MMIPNEKPTSNGDWELRSIGFMHVWINSPHLMSSVFFWCVEVSALAWMMQGKEGPGPHGIGMWPNVGFKIL